MSAVVDEYAFYVQCTGQIENGRFGPLDNMYCRYSFSFGHDWIISSGLDTGLSQTARKNSMENNDEVVWNFPIDITFKATNVHGWPRIAVTVYGADYLGRDVVRGYCSCLLPIASGSHVLDCEMYTPIASSSYNQAMAWLLGNPPEFYDSKFVCQGEGREVTRVQSTGSVRIKLNILTKGMESIGYSI
mmetsp:Transcript_1074/g.1199  ORF Transcript_1074/g.1199 Transcript_1074/m.1199 type:complete len:188 (+) Transcript_1074:119-682(+)